MVGQSLTFQVDGAPAVTLNADTIFQDLKETQEIGIREMLGADMRNICRLQFVGKSCLTSVDCFSCQRYVGSWHVC